MAHPVICFYCKQQFDRDKIPAVQVKVRRYAHASCAVEHGTAEEQALAEKTLADQSKEMQDLQNLEDYIIKLLQIDYINARIRSQINRFHTENNYTYSGMLKSLQYFYEIKGSSTEKANGGIGIIPFVYEDAHTYYRNLWLIQQKNQAKPIEQIARQPETIIKISVPQSPQRKRRKLFAFLDEEDVNGV